MDLNARISLTGLDWGICLSLLVFSIAVGLWIAARMRASAGSNAFFLAGRPPGWPEFLELLYNRAARTFFSGLMVLISVMTKMAFCLFAGALVLNGLVGWGVMKVVVWLGVICAATTIIGGVAARAYPHPAPN